MIATTVGSTLTSLGFERADGDADTSLDDLVINYNGQTINVINHYVAGTPVETIQFENGGTYLGYSLGTGTYQLGTDTVSPLDPANAGNVQDVIASSSVAEELNGRNGNDLLFGNGQDDTINGQGGNDLIVGGAGNDSLDGAGGDDYIAGGTGDDTIDVSNGDDNLRYTGVLDGHDVITGFDGNATSGQDILDLDALFDALGPVSGTRESHVQIVDTNAGTPGPTWEVRVDTDNNTANGFELFVATISSFDAITAGAAGSDILVGT